MAENLKKLIPATVSYVVDHGGYVTKTKLLKLLYLFDVEFYRTHRRIFTGFHWKYFHLGPWTQEFEPALEELVSEDVLSEFVSDRSEFDTKLYRANESLDLGKLFQSLRDEAILKGVLDTWGQKTTAEILDYVYFQTEPMEHGVRNQPLDFSCVSAEVPEPYRRTPSGKKPGEIEALRRQLREKLLSIQTGKKFAFTPPRYDSEFQAALEKLDAGIL